MRSAIACLLTGLLAAACTTQADQRAAAQPQAAAAGTQGAGMSEDEKTRAIAAGREYVKQKFPDFSEARKTPVVSDKGDAWEFTYELPADMLGGAPVVLLSKADLSVTKAYRTQ